MKEVHTAGSDTTKIGNFTYDYENRLVKIVYPFILPEEGPPPSPLGIMGLPPVPPPAPPVDDVYKFVYDANGLRIKKIHNGTTIYHYDEQGNVIQETDGDGNIKATYVYANGQRVAKIKPDGTIIFYINDPLGSPLILMDEDGNIVKRYRFDSWGNIEVQSG